MSLGLWSRCPPSVPINRASLHELGPKRSDAKLRPKGNTTQSVCLSSPEKLSASRICITDSPAPAGWSWQPNAGNNLNVQQKKTGYTSHDGPIFGDTGWCATLQPQPLEPKGNNKVRKDVDHMLSFTYEEKGRNVYVIKCTDHFWKET